MQHELHLSHVVGPMSFGLVVFAAIYLLSWGSAPVVSIVAAALVGLLFWRLTWMTVLLREEGLVIKSISGAHLAVPRQHIKSIGVPPPFGRAVYDVLNGTSLVIVADRAAGFDGFHIRVGHFDRQRAQRWAAFVNEVLQREPK